MTNTTVNETLLANMAELQRDQQELQRNPSVQRYLAVCANLEAMRRTFDFLSESTRPDNSGSANHSNGNGAGANSRMKPGSVGAIALEILKDAGKPMAVVDLLPKVQAKSEKKVGRATLVSTLCNYTLNGKLKRTAPSVYALAT